ncbi:unnamed protein product [Boreogadus saida]
MAGRDSLLDIPSHLRTNPATVPPPKPPPALSPPAPPLHCAPLRIRSNHGLTAALAPSGDGVMQRPAGGFEEDDGGTDRCLG